MRRRSRRICGGEGPKAAGNAQKSGRAWEGEDGDGGSKTKSASWSRVQQQKEGPDTGVRVGPHCDVDAVMGKGGG